MPPLMPPPDTDPNGAIPSGLLAFLIAVCVVAAGWVNG